MGHAWQGIGAAVLLGVLVGGGSMAQAQVCGDANGSGTVTVTDGVQVLAAAAALESSCTTAVCDVNGSGGITVTDGVLTLQIAAQLPVETMCDFGGGGGGVAVETESLTDALVPFISLGVSTAVDAFSAEAAGTAVPAQDTDPCPAGGTRTQIIASQSVRTILLDMCGFVDPFLGTFVFDGSIAVNFARAQVSFAVDVTDSATGTVVNFDGVISGTPTGNGGFLVNEVEDAPLVLTTPQGAFAVRFNNLLVNGEGDVVSGSGTVEDTDDNFGLQSITVTGTGTTNADVLAVQDDGSTANFVLNLDTGELTPA